MKLIPLSTPTPEDLATMTFPSYRHLLDLRPQPRHPELGEVKLVQPFGFVAEVRGERVGLALAEAPAEGTDSPQLLSVFVRPHMRREGIATALVGAVEEDARRRGSNELGTVYTSGKPAIEWMERVFARRRWDPPRPGSLTVTLRPKDGLAFRAFEERRLRAYSRGLEIFPWSEVTEEEAAEIRRSDEESQWIVPQLAPWQYRPSELDDSSVGARYKGRVVGWVLNHRVVNGLVRFSTSYMRPDLARRARILPLYHASLVRVQERGDCRLCTFITPFSYARMIHFIQVWLAPIATSIGESRLTHVDLTGTTT